VPVSPPWGSPCRPSGHPRRHRSARPGGHPGALPGVGRSRTAPATPGRPPTRPRRPSSSSPPRRRRRATRSPLRRSLRSPRLTARLPAAPSGPPPAARPGAQHLTGLPRTRAPRSRAEAFMAVPLFPAAGNAPRPASARDVHTVRFYFPRPTICLFSHYYPASRPNSDSSGQVMDGQAAVATSRLAAHGHWSRHRTAPRGERAVRMADQAPTAAHMPTHRWRVPAGPSTARTGPTPADRRPALRVRRAARGTRPSNLGRDSTDGLPGRSWWTTRGMRRHAACHTGSARPGGTPPRRLPYRPWSFRS
jgi:hypothetical protein